jgi:hypothetical protein
LVSSDSTTPSAPLVAAAMASAGAASVRRVVEPSCQRPVYAASGEAWNRA